MTASTIEAINQQPVHSLSLRERAVFAAEVAEAECARDLAKQRDENRQRRRDDLARALAPLLAGDDSYSIEEDGDDVVATTSDGLRFSMRTPLYEDRAYITRLHLAVHCERGCGQPVWVEVSDIQSIGYALEVERPHLHDCLVKYDEDGEPITDRLGQPLPPRRPQFSPRERANRAVVEVLTAGKQLGEALRLVQTLEDERPARKSAAIRRLMQLENPETNKPHSASSAEKVVEQDQEYFAFRRLQADAEVSKHEAYAAYEAAKLNARLEVETCIRVENGQ